VVPSPLDDRLQADIRRGTVGQQLPVANDSSPAIQLRRWTGPSPSDGRLLPLQSSRDESARRAGLPATVANLSTAKAQTLNCGFGRTRSVNSAV